MASREKKLGEDAPPRQWPLQITKAPSKSVVLRQSGNHGQLRTIGHSLAKDNASSSAGDQLALWKTIIYILRQILDVPTTVALLSYGFIIPEIRSRIADFKMGKTFNPEKDIGNLQDKVILVTGGNAGLGKATIIYLASHKPARIYLAARTASKAESAITDIQSAVPNACDIVHLPLDLTSFSSIAEAADTFKAKEQRLDILINNAGVMATPYSTTKEGYENQFGTNHMGHALLTKLLMPTLLETAKQPDADVRILNVSSFGHYAAVPEGILFDQQALEQRSTWRRYGSSKLANILFTKSLVEYYPQITSVSIHPGVILTDLYTSARANPFLKVGLWIYGWIGRILPGHYKDAAGGALTQTWAATVNKEELVNGAWYIPVGRESAGSKFAQDEDLKKKLWEWTETEFQKHGY